MGKKKTQFDLDLLSSRLDNLSAWIGELESRILVLEGQKTEFLVLPENCKIRFLPGTTTVTHSTCECKKE